MQLACLEPAEARVEAEPGPGFSYRRSGKLLSITRARCRNVMRAGLFVPQSMRTLAPRRQGLLGYRCPESSAHAQQFRQAEPTPATDGSLLCSPRNTLEPYGQVS